jgi:hypothetical protein
MKEELGHSAREWRNPATKDVIPIPSVGPGSRQSMPERRESIVTFSVYGGFGKLHAIALPPYPEDLITSSE